MFYVTLCNEHAKALTYIVSGAPQLTHMGPEPVEHHCLNIEIKPWDSVSALELKKVIITHQ